MKDKEPSWYNIIEWKGESIDSMKLLGYVHDRDILFHVLKYKHLFEARFFCKFKGECLFIEIRTDDYTSLFNNQKEATLACQRFWDNIGKDLVEKLGE